MQIPVLSGVYTDEVGKFRTAYPRNLVPVPTENGIANGYLKHADGIVDFTTGLGNDRGGIQWNGKHYRVMGVYLVEISETGAVTTIGTIGGSGQVRMVYSFTHLAIASSGQLWLYDGGTLAQNKDVDLGTVVDVTWIDGYFATTDGTYIVVTELNNPFSVNPLKYGSSEESPDPILSVAKVRSELVALNRYTIEFFNNVGGNYFPFQRINGALISKGIVGTHAYTIINDTIMFVGSGQNERVCVYAGINGTANKISTAEIDIMLAEYTPDQLSKMVVEHKFYNGHVQLLIHLDKCIVFDITASNAVGKKIWFTLDSGSDTPSQYRGKNHVLAYNKWFVGDPITEKIGYLSEDVSSHFGEIVGWEFNTTIIYNMGAGAIFNTLELVCLSGRYDSSVSPTISTQYSLDGLTWSQEKSISAGEYGDRSKRLTWFLQGDMRNWRIQRFKGTSDSMLSIARLEANIEPLAV